MTTPKNNKPTQEIIGMTLSGIEDYTGDYDSDDSLSPTANTLNVLNKGMIRQSFQQLLPRPSSQNQTKLPLPLAMDMFTISSDDEESDFYDDQKIEEEEPNDKEQLFIDKMVTMIEHATPKKNSFKEVNRHKVSSGDLELDENSETSSDGSSDGSSSATSDDDDDDSTSDKEESSSWGSETDDDIDEGGITYLVTTKPDAKINIHALTPFDSVIDECNKSLKIKFDKITYPMGSKFYSKDLLETEDYHKLQNIQLVKWIKGEEEEKEYEDLAENIKSISLRINPEEDIFAWLQKCINKVYEYYRGDSDSDLTNCFHLMDRSIFEHFHGEGYMLKVEDTDNYALFKLFEILLHIFARLSDKLSTHPKVKRRFYFYLEHTKKMFPKFKVHLDLLKEMHKAHMNKHNAIHCIQSFVQIYHNYQDVDRATDISTFELSVKALVALDLYMENYSPLNHSILSDQAAYDINSEQFKWLDGYKKYKNKYNEDDEDEDPYEEQDKVQLLKLELCSNPQSRINRLTEKYTQFKGFSFLRARVSWVIGHSQLYHQRNFHDSEKYFFEALYCLKKLTQYEFFPLKRTMRTELASLVLIDYADVLLENKKYPYSVIALEKVIDCLKKRKKYDRQFQIIRKLCITCTEKEDWNRAIKYHNITLKKLKDSYLNLNEFVYLSQQVSTIHLKLNNFNQSEKELQNGIQTIYLNVLSYHNNADNNNNNADLRHLSICEIFELCEGEERISIGQLIMVLANVYISGGHYLEQAINLLQYLRKHIFTNKTSTRRILILFQLARAYFKHGRYQIADNIIEKQLLRQYSSKNNKLLSSLEFIQLRVLIMIECKRFKDALQLLDKTMDEMIRKESFVKRAKINYLKGRVLQSRCFDKLMTDYEDGEKRMRLEKKRESARMSAKIVIKEDVNSFTIHESTPLVAKHMHPVAKHMHRRGGPALIFQNSTSNKKDINPLDAQSSLLLSHSDFRAVQDPIMQAKCCLELGQTYLEIIMQYYALPKYVLKNRNSSSQAILKWLGHKIFDDDMTPIHEVINHCLEEINRPLYTALNLSIREAKDVSLLIESYIALAEFEFLQEKEASNQTAKNFWTQSKITFFSTCKDSDDWIFLRRIDRHSRLQMFALFKRILRLLICFENKFIADNVEIFESYIALETFMIAQKDIKQSQNNDKSNKNLFLSNQFSISEKQIAQKSHHIQSKSRGMSKMSIKYKNNKKKKHAKKNTTDFSRYSSAAIYMRSSNLDERKDAATDDTNSQRKIIKNPTVTFRITEGDAESLSCMQLAADPTKTRPLFGRYRKYSKYGKKEEEEKKIGFDSERYLDCLSRMHWKMRTDANMFSGGRMLQIDNDASLVQIVECISCLNVSFDINSTLNRAHRRWSCNETFIISLDSIVFIFHPHTLFKYAISKKRNERPTLHQLMSFASILTNIAFSDGDFLSLEDNPWINQEKEKEIIRRKKHHYDAHVLADDKQELLQNELTLPYLKLESVKELLMCLDPQNILNVLGAIFSECQIIILSRERCRALAIMDALFALMYPFAWQYPCIPWLSPNCFELLKLPIPYIFGVANIASFHDIMSANKYDICGAAVIIDADTNNLMKPANSFHQLPLKIKSKLTRAMFRLMSGLLKTEFLENKNNNWVFPPRRRENMNTQNYKLDSLSRSNVDCTPQTAPISICSQRKSWYTTCTNKNEDRYRDQNVTKRMLINFQKEFCTAFVEVLEQYRLFWVNINSALHKDLKSKSMGRIQKYAHPRYRKFLTEIQKTRMFSSFQCIRSLANTDMLKSPMFDNLVMKSLKWRQSLYHEIIRQQQTEHSRMKVSVQHSHKRYFMNHFCSVIFDPKECKLYITPDGNLATSQRNLLPFEVILKATDYELESDDFEKLHPYMDPKQVQKYGERYQFKIKHQKDGTLTLNCKNYYELTRWIHMIRTHSMDTWSWFLKF